MKLQHKKIVLNQIFSYNFGGVCRIMFINETEDCIGDITNVFYCCHLPTLRSPGRMRVQEALSTAKQYTSKLGVLEGHRP